MASRGGGYGQSSSGSGTGGMTSRQSMMASSGSAVKARQLVRKVILYFCPVLPVKHKHTGTEYSENYGLDTHIPPFQIKVTN